MTIRKLREHLMKIGRCAMLIGMILSVRGLWLGNAALIGVGCLLLLSGVYTVVYAHVGSF